MTSFLEFSKTADELSKVSSKLSKVALLSKYFAKLSKEELYYSTIWFTGNAFAQKDKRKLNVGKGIVRDALMIVGSIDSKEKYNEIYLKFGETGETAEFILKGRTIPENVTVEATAKYFVEFSNISSSKQKASSLATFMRKLSTLEAKYLVKILTGDLRIGVQESLVEEAIADVFYKAEKRDKKGSPDKEFKKYAKSVKWSNMLTGDIGEVAILAKNGKLEESKMHLHHPLKCMLATAEATVEDLAERMKGEKWAADDKYDGIRAHVHKTGDQITIFSRDLNDITLVFPEIVWYVSRLKGDMLLDGEIVARKDGKSLPFFLLQKRLGRKSIDKALLAEAPASYIVYDILYLNGEVLLDKSYKERRAKIEAMEIKTSGVEISDMVYVENAKELLKAFKDSKSRGNEGLMLKDPLSTYKPGKRGISWLKYKETLEPIDVVVTGVEFGEGRRRNDLSDYTFSVWDKNRKNLVTLGKVYSGATDASVAELTELFKKITIKDHGKYRDVEPKVVFEVQYESIQKSDRHKSGFALRFPRITKIRLGDKGVDDIDDLKRVEDIWKKFSGK